jgi:hypothetical protein
MRGEQHCPPEVGVTGSINREVIDEAAPLAQVRPAHRAPFLYLLDDLGRDFGFMGRVAKSIPHAVNKE